MAKLDMESRTYVAEALQKRLPPHWKVIRGSERFAFIEVDQDGECPAHRFHTVGSTVIEIRNAQGKDLLVQRYVRVPCPPGYCEARKIIDATEVPGGLGWRDRLVEAVVAWVAESDAELVTREEAEA